MPAENIQFTNDTINIATGTGGLLNGTTKLSGTLTVDYGAMTVSGSLTDTNGNTYTTFSFSSTNGTYTLVSTGGSSTVGGMVGALAYTISVAYPTTTMAPGSVTTVSKSVANNTNAETDNVPVNSSTAPCYVTGTNFNVERSSDHCSVAVEALAVGDRVLTSGGTYRPIRWIGSRAMRCASHPRPAEAYPIRIAANAFGAARPDRDLFVSPGHAICVDVVGEVLIPAQSLVNGTTIAQVEVDEVTYWHVELDSHDVILADNLPAESYLEMGNRGFFADADVVVLAASPDAPPPTHAGFCRPFHAQGRIVEIVRERLERVAGRDAARDRARAA